MGLYADRKDLLDQGFELPPMISFNVFWLKWLRYVNDKTSKAIIREFYDDYLTSTYQSVEEYFKAIEE